MTHNEIADSWFRFGQGAGLLLPVLTKLAVAAGGLRFFALVVRPKR